MFRLLQPHTLYQLESRADAVTTVASSCPPGTAHLEFSRAGSDTVLTRAFATSPAKLIATHGRGATCWVYMATLGGGFVGGDDIRTTATIAAGARALLTTQASTKIYRSARRSKQHIAASVGQGGLLAVVPDPVVCYAGADFAQTQRYELHASASLVLVDWLTSGRHASGERWLFSRYESRIHIIRDGRPVAADAVVLEPALGSVAERMARFDVFLTMVVTGPLVARACDMMLRAETQELAAQGASARLDANVVLASSPLRDGGVLVRMAGANTESVGRALRLHLSFLPALLGDDLWSRKW